MHICIYANIHACISTLSIYTSYLRRARTRSRWPPAHREAAAGVRLRQNSRISVKIFKYRDIEAIGFADSQNTVPPPHAHTLTERERERERERTCTCLRGILFERVYVCMYVCMYVYI